MEIVYWCTWQLFTTVHLWYYSCCHITSCVLLSTYDIILVVILLHVYFWPPVMLFLVACYFMFITDHLWCYSWCHVISCLLLSTCDVIPSVMLLLFITVHLRRYSWCHVTSCLLLSTCDVIPGVILLHVYYWPPVMLFLVSCYFMFITDHLWCYS
jgi:hypothetical protein